MSKVKSNAEYQARLVEISNLINPQHGNREGKVVKNTTAKKGRVPQLDDAAGLNIEKIRQKLLENKKPLTQVELNLIRNAFETWYQSRETNNTVARVVFHAITAVFTVGLFHLGYLVARLFNKNLPLDSSKEVFSVFRSYKVMKKVESFLSDTKDFKPIPVQPSFRAINQALDTGEKATLGTFPINTDELDDILKDNSDLEVKKESSVSGEKATLGNFSINMAMLDEIDLFASGEDESIDSQSFDFNTYL